MPRVSALLSVVAPVLAVLFALAAIGLVLTSRPEPPPRLADLTTIDGTLRAQSSGLSSIFGGKRLPVLSGGREHSVDAAGCSKPAGELRAGDQVTVWVDRQSRAWRISRGTKPLCTFIQAATEAETARHTKRVVAVVLAVAGVAGAGVTMFARSRRG
jgi:hypothetical protein